MWELLPCWLAVFGVPVENLHLKNWDPRYLNGQNAPFELVNRIMKFVDYRLEKSLGRGLRTGIRQKQKEDAGISAGG